MSQQAVIENLAQAIECMPGYSALKSLESQYIAVGVDLPPVLGFKHASQLVGLQYHELRCQVAEFADLFVTQDKMLIKQKNSLSIIETFRYANGTHTLMSQKSLVKDKKGMPIAILCQSLPVLHESIIKAIYSLLSEGSLVLDQNKNFKVMTFLLCDKYERLGLSQRQSECLYYLMRGKSASSIGDILGISNRTVESHINEIKNKLYCTTQSQVIEKAVNSGYANLLPKSILQRQISVS